MGGTRTEIQVFDLSIETTSFIYHEAILSIVDEEAFLSKCNQLLTLEFKFQLLEKSLILIIFLPYLLEQY